MHESDAIRACLAYKRYLETCMLDARGPDRERLQAQILAGVKLIERLQREAAAHISFRPPQPRRRAPRRDTRPTRLYCPCRSAGER